MRRRGRNIPTCAVINNPAFHYPLSPGRGFPGHFIGTLAGYIRGPIPGAPNNEQGTNTGVTINARITNGLPDTRHNP